MTSLPQEMRTACLLLRPFRFSDVEAVLGYADDEEWSRYMPLPFPYERTDAEQFIARAVLADRSIRAGWALVLDGTVIGGTGITVDPENRSAELGWSLARQHWGKGLATEAAKAVLDAAFTADPDLNRVQARADARNVASLRVMAKLGMRSEGCRMQNQVVKGEPIDMVCYGILRSEWQLHAGTVSAPPSTSLEDEIYVLELQLLDPEVRSSRERLEELLADDFSEIGSSGRVFEDRAAIVAALAADSGDTRYSVEDFEIRQLGPSIVLATYRVHARISGRDDGLRTSLRSSIWVRRERWRLVFHQGTAAAAS